MERTLYLLTAYDGTDFHGWQKQPGVRTVQCVLEEAICRCVRHPVHLICSGRTDSGVHATGHVCSFVTTSPLSPDKIRHSIGSRLPDDLSVITVRDVPRDFDAQQSACSKLYRYRIFHSTHRPVEKLLQRYTYHCWNRLDLDAMRSAARYFVGEQDFTSVASKSQERESMVREVLRCDLERHEGEIRIDIEGTGFLYKQVRNMVGTLIEVGRGRWKPEYVAEILAARDRSRAGPTVPAKGLCLICVRYPSNQLVEPESSTNQE